MLKPLLKALLCCLPLGLYAQAEYPITASSGGSSGTYSIWSNVDTAATLSQLDQPIIIVEGYDPTDEFDGNRIYEDFDENITNNLAQRLRDEGYDLVILDFDANNTRPIGQNAQLLIDLINQVNAQKIGNEELVVVGLSMGGLIAKTALSTMEFLNTPHETRLYISFDTPHRGAYISVAAQMFINTAVQDPIMLSLAGGVLLALDQELQGDALRQMLLFHEPSFTSGGSSGETAKPHSSFGLNQPSGSGLPQQCKNIAIANGAKTGLTQLNARDEHIEGVSLALQISKNSSVSASNVLVTMFSLPDITKLVMPPPSSGMLLFQLAHFFNQQIRSIDVSTIDPIDFAPGGTTPIYQEIADGFEAIGDPDITVDLDMPNACFIPTVSALDLDVPYLTNINADRAVLCSVPFDAFYAPLTVNQEHTALLQPTANWLFNQITQDDTLIVTFLNNNRINFGGNNNDLLFEHLLINWGGTVEVNTINPAGFSILNINQEPRPDSGSVFTLHTNCNRNTNIIVQNAGTLRLGNVLNSLKGVVEIYDKDTLFIKDNGEVELRSLSEINIRNGGVMVIEAGGEANIRNDAQININEGGMMIIEDGGEADLWDDAALNINDGGQLIIEDGGVVAVHNIGALNVRPGGSLNYQKGAVLFLENYSSTVKVQGNVTVADNATFTISGLGKMIFDQDVPWVNNPQTGIPEPDVEGFWTIGDNAEFIFYGPGTPSFNPTHNLLVIEKSLYLRMKNGKTFSKIDLRRGQVVLFPGELMYCYGPTTTMQMRFVSAYPGYPHAGLRVWHNSGLNAINGSTFEDGEPGLMVHWSHQGDRIVIGHNEFNNNVRGVVVNSGRFVLQHCKFFDNELGLEGNGLRGLTHIRNNHFDGNTTGSGAMLMGQEGTVIYVEGNIFENSIYGLFSIGVDVSSECSFFQNNWQGVGLSNSKHYMSHDAGNHFKNNDVGIYFVGEGEETGFYLNDGHNTFDLGIAGRLYASGQTYGSRLSSEYSTSLTDHIMADNNKMPLVSDGSTLIMPTSMFYDPNDGSPLQEVRVDIPNNLTTTDPACDTTITILSDNPYQNEMAIIPTGGGILMDPAFDDYPDLREALIAISGKVSWNDDQLSDLEALRDLTLLLHSEIDGEDQNTGKLLKLAYDLMFKALNNAYLFDELPFQGGAETPVIDEDLSHVLSVIDTRLSNINENDPLYKQTYYTFKYHLDLAHAYRVAGLFEEALGILDIADDWTHTTEQALRAQYWECVCQIEHDYYSGVIEEESYSQQLYYCTQTYAGYNYKSNPIPISTGYSVDDIAPQILDLYPQPASQTLTVQIAPAQFDEVTYQITNLTGQMVEQGTLHWQGDRQDFDVQDLSTGVYVLTLTFQNGTKTLKLVKQ